MSTSPTDCSSIPQGVLFFFCGVAADDIVDTIWGGREGQSARERERKREREREREKNKNKNKNIA